MVRQIAMNIQQWNTLMTRLGLPPSIETFNALIAAHSEPTRHYHNVEHITSCLRLLERFRARVPKAALVELAFWFHDAVYQAPSKTNEEDSADWAVTFLEESAAAKEVCSTVYALIMATKHAVTQLSPAEQWMVDIDLSILGTEPAVFDQYEQNIRLEYEWVPLEEYRTRRAALLQGFLERTWIFNADTMRNLYETQARENLSRSIAQLS